MADKHPDIYRCNHHHPIRDDEEFVDFGTGPFVADKPLIPLLKALNEAGLVTRTHNFSADEHSFIGIIVPENMTVEFRTVTEPVANRDTFRGQREMLISWDATKLSRAEAEQSEKPDRIDIRAMSTATDGSGSLKLRFGRPHTENDRKNVLAAINAWNSRTPDPELDEELKVTKEFLAVADKRLSGAVKALRLFDEWWQMRTDRGGKDGPKGQAYARFVEAKDKALSDVPVPLAELKVTGLAEVAEKICRKLESETESVTILDQTELREALSALARTAADVPVGVQPRVERNEPGHDDSGGRVVVDFQTDDEMRAILGALDPDPDGDGLTDLHKVLELGEPFCFDPATGFIHADDGGAPAHGQFYVPKEAPTGDGYLVWSNQHNAWWRANSQGYAKSIRHAGVYTREEAVEIARSSRDGMKSDEIPSELAIRIADLPADIQAALPPAPTGGA